MNQVLGGIMRFCRLASILFIVLFQVLCHPVGYGEPNVLLDAEKSLQDTDIRPQDVIHWRGEDARSYPDGLVVLQVRLVTEQGFGLYADEIKFTSSSGYVLESYKGPQAEKIDDPVAGKPIDVYYSGSFELRFRGSEPLKDPIFPLSVRYIGCTSRICLFPFTDEIKISSFYEETSLSSPSKAHSGDQDRGDRTSEDPNSNDSTTQFAPSNDSTSNDSNDSQKETSKDSQLETASYDDGLSASSAPSQLNLEEMLIGYLQSEQTSFVFLLLLIFVAGFLTNLTPCVYPMIPITLRLLSGQSRSPMKAALAYALGIVLVYTGLGVGASLTGSMFGQYMASKPLNIALALLMATMAITMLGFGDFASIQTMGTKLEKRSKKGVKRAFLMGCGAGFVASPCTGPIMAMLLTYLATGQGLWRSILCLFIYSLGFALPYVFLARMSSYLVKRKVSPSIQVSTKLIFAAVMFSLAFYYLRIPLQGTYEFLQIYWHRMAVVSLVLATLLFGLVVLFRRLNDKVILIFPAFLLGVSFFSAGQWFMKSDSVTPLNIRWFDNNEEQALMAAKKSSSPILIDMWAEWCESCKKMEATTFRDKDFIREVRERGWVLLRFDLTEANEKSDKIQNRFGIQSLPTLVIIPNAEEPEKRVLIHGYVSAARLLNHMRMLKKE